MFKLITKQGFLNLKKHWNLYLPYFFFLFFSFWIIFAFFGFAFNFDTTGHQVINPQNNPSYSLKLFNYGFDQQNEKEIKLDQQQHQDLWSFFQNKYPCQDEELLKKLVIKSGQQNGYLTDADFAQDQTEIKNDVNKYHNNLLICWLYESNLFFDKSSDEHWTGFDELIDFEMVTNQGDELVNISTFKIEDWTDHLNLDIKEWQKHDYLDEFYWIEKSELLKANDDHQIVLTPKFADAYHLKVGDPLTLKVSASETKTFKVVGLAIKRSRALVDNSHDAYLSPLFYNQVIKNNSDVRMTNLDVTTKFKANKNRDYDDFYQKQFQKYETILSTYFQDLNQKPSGELKKISTSTFGSLETQVFIYYFLVSMICLVLIILLIVIYLVISQNNIQSQKEQIYFLKSLGTNNYWLSYFISIMVVPFIFWAFILAVGLTNFIYKLITALTLNSIGFNLSQSSFTDWKLIVLICSMFWLISFLSYLIVFWKIQKFNLSFNEDQNQIKMTFYRKFPRFLVGQVQTKSMILKNVKTSVQLFGISFFTFLVLGITWQFIVSINAAAQSNQQFFAPYESYSYQTLKSGQVNYDEKISEEKLLKSENFSELARVDFSNAQEIIKWISNLQQEEDISHKYFNQVEEFINPTTLKTIEEIANDGIREKIKAVYSLISEKFQLYLDYFGLTAPTPIINFKYIIFPNDHYRFSSVFKTTINNYLVTAYADEKFDQQVGLNQVTINYLLAHDLNLKVGDSLKIKHLNLETNQEDEVVKTIANIETKINDHYQIILNSAITSQWLIEKNAIFSQKEIPVGLKYLTIPVMQNNGLKIEDYWDFNQPKINDFNLTVASFPWLEKAIHSKTNSYLNLLIIISSLMILTTLIILILIGLVFAQENQSQIALLKIVGYSFKKLISSIIVLLSISLMISWVLTSILSAIIIKKSSSLLLDKILVEINPVLNFETLGINLIVAFLILVSILFWIYILYKKSSINRLT